MIDRRYILGSFRANSEDEDRKKYTVFYRRLIVNK